VSCKELEEHVVGVGMTAVRDGLTVAVGVEVTAVIDGRDVTVGVGVDITVGVTVCIRVGVLDAPGNVLVGVGV